MGAYDLAAWAPSPTGRIVRMMPNQPIAAWPHRALAAEPDRPCAACDAEDKPHLSIRCQGWRCWVCGLVRGGWRPFRARTALGLGWIPRPGGAPWA